MKWIHIMDQQPIDGQRIVELHPIGKDHKRHDDYLIGFREYKQHCTMEQLLKYHRENQIPDPDIWWMAMEDFSFPTLEDRKNEMV